MNQNNTLTDIIDIPKSLMMLSFKCSNHFQILLTNLGYVLMPLIWYFCLKFVKNTNMLVEQGALMLMVFEKQPGCALIGACVLVRTNKV